MRTAPGRLPLLLFASTLSLGSACNRTDTAPAPAAPTVAPAPAPAAAPAPAPAPAAAPAPTPAAAPAPAPAPAAPAAAPAHPDLCEVEFSGEVKWGKPLPTGQRFYVFIAQGDCMAKDAHILAATPVNNETSRFFYEVFPKWGSDLSLCAAAVTAPDQPAKLYGKATGKYHAEATGEVTFEQIVITPKPGPARTFPKPRPAIDPEAAAGAPAPAAGAPAAPAPAPAKK